jgi:hypothetical protein
MPVSTVFEYCQSINATLLIEYFYKGEKIDDPELYFDLNQGLFEFAYPSEEETQMMIDRYVIFSSSHKLVISEYGFHLIHL